MTQQTPFFPLGGGMDLMTPAIALKPGVVIAAVNYESAPTGYRRIDGYERFDGGPSPSEAFYVMIDFEFGETAIVAGNVISGGTSGATGTVLTDAIVDSGAWDGTARGRIGVGSVVGTFIAGEVLSVAGFPVADSDSVVDLGSTTDEEATLWVAAARDLARAIITAVPGSGPVRGVWEYKGAKYAFRDNVGATAGVMHKATPTGWEAVVPGRSLPFTSGGVHETVEGETITGETSGATALVRRVVLQTGSFGAGDAAGYIVVSGQAGVFVAESIKVGATLDVATVAGNSSAIGFPAGGRYEFVNHNFYGQANMLRMYGVNGVGPGFEFDGVSIVPIITGSAGENPHRVAVHRQSLALAFLGGSVLLSPPGEPLVWNATLGSVEFAVGDEITDFIAANKTVLTILGKQTVSNLYGNDASDYQVETLTDESGALPWTADKIGQAIYMDHRGVRSMASTQAFGDFNIGTLTQKVQPMIQNYQRANVAPVSAMRVRAKDQYRVFFEDMSGLSIYMARKEPEVMPFILNHKVTCSCSVETEVGEELYFGSDDGFVYSLDKGDSFDGEPVPYYLRLPFNHQGAPQVLKRWHKAVVECQTLPIATLSVTAEFDYGDPDELSADIQNFDVRGGGGSWDLSNWDQFYWSSPLYGTAECYLDGVGKNMSLLFAGEAVDEPPHLLQGVTLFFTPRGLRR